MRVTSSTLEQAIKAHDESGATGPVFGPGPLGVKEAVAQTDPLLQFFEFGHLPEHLQVVSSKFYEAAHSLIALVPRNPERTVALRKLMEAKDCAVRAMIYKD